MLSITILIFFFNDTATTEIYTLSLHDALPISHDFVTDADRAAEALIATTLTSGVPGVHGRGRRALPRRFPALDRKSTRLNSSHSQISYAVFCFKKKKTTVLTDETTVPTAHTLE